MDSHYEFNPKIYLMIASNIKKYRREKKISIEDLSKYSGIDIDYLRALENNTEEDLAISIDELYKISVILDVNINDFFD